MIELYQAAQRIQEYCGQKRWRFCFIGGLAVLRWGRIRATNDIDLTLLTGFGGEEVFVDELLKSFKPRLADGREFALRNRVLLVQDATGIPIDVALGAVPFEERSIERSTLWEADDGLFLRTCSAEDLLVHKCFANRDLDWSDVENILARQGDSINLKRTHSRRRKQP